MVVLCGCDEPTDNAEHSLTDDGGDARYFDLPAGLTLLMNAQIETRGIDMKRILFSFLLALIAPGCKKNHF